MRSVKAVTESFPIAGTFTISRGAKTAADVVVCTISQDGVSGRGECVPYGRYGETLESVMAEIAAMTSVLESGLSRQALQTDMRPGAARNAIDCALWDLESKRSGHTAWNLARLSAPQALTTAYTISLGEPDIMAAQAAKYAHRSLLKVKVGTANDESRMRAVRAAAPHCAIILDANEGWRDDTLDHHFNLCAELGISLVEQPLPAGKDQALAGRARPIIVCADESVHKTEDLAALTDRYDAINIKLDKAGGLTEALIMRDRAQALGLKIMVGCMVGTSLAMAPAMLVAQGADFVDLDGPLLLANDRDAGLVYDASLVFPPEPSLWG